MGRLLRKGPVDFHTETLEVLTKIGNAVPAEIELGYHLCYCSPADELSRAAKGHGDHGRDGECHLRRRRAFNPIFPYASAGTAPTTPILRRSKIFVCTPRPSSTSASFITTMRKAMRRG